MVEFKKKRQTATTDSAPSVLPSILFFPDLSKLLRKKKYILGGKTGFLVMAI